jgi:hypothetical protein
MQKLFSLKDESRQFRTWGRDGSADDVWDEDYAVINFRGEVVFRTTSRVEAECWIRAETARFFGSARPKSPARLAPLPMFRRTY